MAAERPDGEVVGGRLASSIGNDAASDGGGGGGRGGGGSTGGGDRASSDRVTLLRSEVRVQQHSSENDAASTPGEPGGSILAMDMQLQVGEISSSLVPVLLGHSFRGRLRAGFVLAALFHVHAARAGRLMRRSENKNLPIFQRGRMLSSTNAAGLLVCLLALSFSQRSSHRYSCHTNPISKSTVQIWQPVVHV